jgi:hypothetical protein
LQKINAGNKGGKLYTLQFLRPNPVFDVSTETKVANKRIRATGTTMQLKVIVVTV